MCFAVNFFVLFFWLFTQLLEYVGMSFATFEKLSVIISVSTFLSSSFFLLSLSPRTWMLDLLLQSHRPLRLCSFFFQSIFSLLLRLDNFYCSTFKLNDSSLGSFYSAVEFILWGSLFFFLIIMLSSSKISICFFIISSISLLKLSVLISFKHIYYYLLKYFTTVFQSLSDDLNFPVISMLASIDCVLTFNLRLPDS